MRLCERSAKGRIFRFATFILSVFHHPHETFFDLTRFRRYWLHGARRNEWLAAKPRMSSGSTFTGSHR
jgi:hypothetical protein